MKILKKIAFTFLIIGGLNWGVYGLSGYDLVHVVFGKADMVARIVYVLVGLSAIYTLFNKFFLCSCQTCDCDGCQDCTCDIKINTISNPSEPKF